MFLDSFPFLSYSPKNPKKWQSMILGFDRWDLSLLLTTYNFFFAVPLAYTCVWVFARFILNNSTVNRLLFVVLNWVNISEAFNVVLTWRETRDEFYSPLTKEFEDEMKKLDDHQRLAFVAQANRPVLFMAEKICEQQGIDKKDLIKEFNCRGDHATAANLVPIFHSRTMKSLHGEKLDAWAQELQDQRAMMEEMQNRLRDAQNEPDMMINHMIELSNETEEQTEERIEKEREVLEREHDQWHMEKDQLRRRNGKPAE